MKELTDKEIVINYVEAINSVNMDQIEKLMSEDHIFVDSGDSKTQGKENMIQGWVGYFKLFPDYQIEIIDITESDSLIGIFGYASGTYKGLKDDINSNYYRTPAAWKVIVQDGKIKYWQVYCESKKIEEIVEKNQ